MNQDHVFVLAAYDSASCVLVLLMLSKPKTWEEIVQPPHDLCHNAMADMTGSKAATPLCNNKCQR